MATLSVSVPDELKEKMSLLDEVNWSAVARRAFEDKIRQIETMKKLAGKSSLTEKDAEKIGKTISRKMAAKFERMK